MSIRNFNNTTTVGTLTGPVAGSAATIVVSGLAQNPPVPFTATIDRNLSTEEAVLVTAVNSGTLTVTRGFDGTAAQSHTAGATIEHTAGAIEYTEANQHVNATSGVHGTTGALVGTDGAQTLYKKTLLSPVVTADPVAGDAVVAFIPSGAEARNLFRGVGSDGTDKATVDSSGKVTTVAGASVGGNVTVGGTLAVSGVATASGGAVVPTGKKLTLTDAPSAITDAANKAYVDGKTWPTSALADAASAATPGVAVKRDANGRAQFADPAVAADVATKNYVDTHAAVNDSGWKTVAVNAPVGGTALYRIINGIVYLLFNETYNVAAYSSTFPHCTLPAEARPGTAQLVQGGYYSNTIEFVQIGTDGVVRNSLGSGASPGGFVLQGSYPL